MRQEDFRKLFEEENDPLRANALSYDFAGEPDVIISNTGYTGAGGF